MGSSLFSVPPDASRNTTLLEGDLAPNLGSGHQTAIEEENRRLKRENDVLRQERDILKKAVCIFSRGQQ